MDALTKNSGVLNGEPRKLDYRVSDPKNSPQLDVWQQKWLGALPQVLNSYNLSAYSAEFLRANENIVFGVTEKESGNRYALRLHDSKNGAFSQLRRDAASITSELLWLEALAKETDVIAPQPVRTIDGELTVEILLDSSDGCINGSLLRWVDGSNFDKAVPNAAWLVREIGRTLARLEEHGRSWNKPEGFTRPTYDRRYLEESLRVISDGIPLNVLNEADYDIISRTAQHVASVMDELGAGSEVWGLGHFDLGSSNCLVFGEAIRPIDFSLCGFGHYLFDLATAMGDLPVAHRGPCLAGYREATGMPNGYVPLLDVFLMMSIFNCWAFHIRDENQHHWLKPHIAKVVRNKCPLVLNGESFILRIP